MTKDEAIALLQASRPRWSGFGVKTLFLFGSVVRGEVGPDSDVDLLVEFDRPVGLFEFAGLQRVLSEILARKVDLVTPAALKRRSVTGFWRRPFVPPRDWRLRIEDMLEAIERVRSCGTVSRPPRWEDHPC